MKDNGEGFLGVYNALRGGQQPVIPSTLIRQHFKSFASLVIGGDVPFIKIRTNDGICSLGMPSGADSIMRSQSLTYEIGRALDVEININKICEGAFGSRDDLLPAHGTPLLLDTSTLVLLQTRPKEIRDDLRRAIKLFPCYASAWSLREIHEWLNGNILIKDNIRRQDYIERIQDGLGIIDVGKDILEESANLREFNGDLRQQIMAATARRLGATYVGFDEVLLTYPFIKSLHSFSK
jgi:PIN domain nuclease of toxin-antitoxin system